METEFPAEWVFDELRKTFELVTEQAVGYSEFLTELPRSR